MKNFLGLDAQDWKDIAKHVFPAIVVALVIVWAGSNLGAPWLVIPVTPLLTGAGFYLITKNDDIKIRKAAVLKAVLFGLIFGLATFIFA